MKKAALKLSNQVKNLGKQSFLYEVHSLAEVGMIGKALNKLLNA